MNLWVGEQGLPLEPVREIPASFSSFLSGQDWVGAAAGGEKDTTASYAMELEQTKKKNVKAQNKQEMLFCSDCEEITAT